MGVDDQPQSEAEDMFWERLEEMPIEEALPCLDDRRELLLQDLRARPWKKPHIETTLGIVNQRIRDLIRVEARTSFLEAIRDLWGAEGVEKAKIWVDQKRLPKVKEVIRKFTEIKAHREKKRAEDEMWFRARKDQEARERFEAGE